MKKEKLYYDEDKGQFYWVRQTPKMIFIKWVEHKNCDGSLLDQNVDYKELVVRKNNSGKHCLKENDEEGILIYPYRDGQPFYLEPATITHIISEIADCVLWGVSSEYYENLKQYVDTFMIH